MRRTVITATILVLLSAVANGQNGWVWQNPLPQGNTVHDVHAIDGNNAILLTSHGTLLKTHDAGQTWTISTIVYYDEESGQTKETEDNTPAAIFVQDQNNYWVVGQENLIIHTTDGGITWNSRPVPQPQPGPDFDITDPTTWPPIVSYHFKAVHFVSETNGWAVGYQWILDFITTEVKGAVLATTDGGTTWVDQMVDTDKWLFDVHALDSNTAWVAGGEYNDAVLFKTGDGGTNWVRQEGLPGYDGINSVTLQSVQFFDEMLGWVAGGSDLTLKTEDGGQSWQQMDFSFTTYPTGPQQIHFFDQNNGWVIGKYILHTNDGGESWTEQKSTPGGSVASFRRISSADANQAFIAGPGSEIYHTASGGMTWNTLSSGTSRDLSSIFFLDINNGWAVGEDFAYQRTNDGGANWADMTLPVDGRGLTDVLFLDEQIGFMTGDQYVGAYLNGSVFKTTDGGNGWMPKGDFHRATPQAICFIDNKTGWCVGEDATIHKTVDGGESWISQENPFTGTTNKFEDVFFTDENKGWIVGDTDGWLLHTQDGGETWAKQNSQTEEWFGSAYFRTPLVGWIAGGDGWSEGTILHTTDGGDSWSLQSDEDTPMLNSVWFADDAFGWCVGNAGAILSTSDGGATWTVFQSGMNQNINHIVGVGKNRFWIAGEAGSILHWHAQNRPPEIIKLVDITIENSGNYIVDLDSCVTDADHQPSEMTWEIVPSDTSIKVVQTNHHITISAPNWTGTGTIQFTVRDPAGATDVHTINITVTAPTAIRVSDSGIPTEYCLKPNFPNPFNPQTVFTFGLPKDGHVVISIYNIRGELVSKLVDERRTAGYHQIQWDASEVAGGTYFIHLQAGAFMSVQKCLYLK